MDLYRVELTIEDILSIHRHWITKLYVEEHKSESEIVEMLYAHHLPVTLSQIQKCLRDWNLISSALSTCSSSSASTSTSTTHSNDDDEWQVARCPSPASSTCSEPHLIEMYSKRPLPGLPTKSKSSRSSVSETKKRKTRPGKDFLKVTVHNRSSKPFEVEMTLGIVPEGPTPLQRYTLEQQSYERVAVGLGRGQGTKEQGDGGTGATDHDVEGDLQL